MATRREQASQPPADPNAPRAGGASFNSEQGFSDPRNAPEGAPAPAMAENRDPEGRQAAAQTDPATVHTARGMQVGAPVLDPQGRPVPGGGMIGGGDIANEFLPPPPPPSPAAIEAQWAWRAAQSPFGRSALSNGRAVTEWGLMGKGTTVRGFTVAINVDTFERDVFHDGHVIEEDGLWVNARNFPEYLTTGTNLAELAAGR